MIWGYHLHAENIGLTDLLQSRLIEYLTVDVYSNYDMHNHIILVLEGISYYFIKLILRKNYDITLTSGSNKFKGLIGPEDINLIYLITLFYGNKFNHKQWFIREVSNSKSNVFEFNNRLLKGDKGISTEDVTQY